MFHLWLKFNWINKVRSFQFSTIISTSSINDRYVVRPTFHQFKIFFPIVMSFFSCSISSKYIVQSLCRFSNVLSVQNIWSNRYVVFLLFYQFKIYFPIGLSLFCCSISSKYLIQSLCRFSIVLSVQNNCPIVMSLF